MDPRDRADETLARARARGAFVVTPDSATSPMDASNTVRIPREVVAAADQAGRDPNATRSIPHSERPPEGARRPEQGQGQQGQQGQPGQQAPHGQGQQARQPEPEQYGWPAEDYQEPATQQLPPNPYHAQRSAGQFGPLGSHAAQRNFPS